MSDMIDILLAYAQAGQDMHDWQFDMGKEIMRYLLLADTAVTVNKIHEVAKEAYIKEYEDPEYDVNNDVEVILDILQDNGIIKITDNIIKLNHEKEIKSV